MKRCWRNVEFSLHGPNSPECQQGFGQKPNTLQPQLREANDLIELLGSVSLCQTRRAATKWPAAAKNAGSDIAFAILRFVVT